MTDILHEPVFEASAAGPPARKPWYRRPLVVIPIVLAVVAAAVVTTVVLVVNAGVRVHGTVFDSMTGNPLASATISAGDRTATADAHGVFALDKIHKDATVTISAANYTPVEIKATTAAAVVRLAPIPVRATVSSALTGTPLAATLTMPDGTRVASDPAGVATVYHVGSGDQVTVGAEGYVTATVPVTGDRTITATLQPAFATVAGQLEQWAAANQGDKIVNWVLSPATGFQYQPVSDLPALPPGVWGAGREVVGLDTGVFVALLPGMGVEKPLLEGVFGGNAQPVTIADWPAWHGAVPEYQGAFASVWMRQPLVIMVFGSDLSTTDKVLTGIVAAQPAS
jgi:hypothetical protein